MSRAHTRNTAAWRLLLPNVDHVWPLLLAASITSLSSGGLCLSSQAQTSPPSAAGENTDNSAAKEKAAATKAMTPKLPRRAGRSNDEDKDAKECRLPVVITFREREGVVARTEPFQDSDLRQDSLLISINGQSLRDKTPAEITKLCTGNEGDTGVLGVLDREGVYQTFTFKCKWLRKTQVHSQPISQLRSMLYRFDCTNGPHWDPAIGRPEEQYDAGNLDLFTSASCRGKLTLAQDDPASSAALVDSAAIGSAGWLFTEGNLPEAQRLLKIVETTPLFDSEKPRMFDKEYGPLLTMLDLCGLNAKAVKIGGAVMAADEAGKFPGIGDRRFRAGEVRLPAYKAYLQNLARSKDSDIAPAINRLQKQAKEASFIGGDTDLWLGDFYESLGQYDKAITCYETSLAKRENHLGRTYTKSDSPDRLVSDARYHCYLLFRLAQFATKQNTPQKAAEYLLRAQQIYSSFFTEDQLTHIESVPMFSPSPSAVELALAGAYLKVGDSAAAVKYTKSAVERLRKAEATDTNGTVSLPSVKELTDGLKSGKWADQVAAVGPIPYRGEPTEEDRRFMSAFMSADAAVANGNMVAARKWIDTLLSSYQKREFIKEYPRPRANMYCCLLNLARRLADRGQFEESNKLLDKLRISGSALEHTAVTDLFIDIEKALNAEMARHPQPQLWQNVFDGWKSSYTDYQCLRSLACLYLAAGEYGRAEIMIDNALKICQHNTKDDTSAAFSKALLSLDKAYMASSTSKFDQAQKHIALALATVDSMPVSAASRDLDLFNRMYMCRAVQLAQINRLSNRSTEAEKILKEVVSRLESKKSWLGVFEVSAHPTIDTSQSYLYGYYGRLLCDHKKYGEARPYLDKAIIGCRNDVPNFLRTVRAGCAAQQGDYAAAAQDLSALVRRHSNFGTSIMSVQPKWKEAYSRMAIDYALKAKGFSPDELAKLYKQLADLLSDDASKTEKLELRKKAYALMSDSSRDKGELAQEIANLSAMNRGANTAGPSQVDRAAQFKMLESAALLAEKNNGANAAQSWMQLAGGEVQAKQYDQAIEHIKRAINALAKRTEYSLEGLPITSISDWPIRGLAEAGRQKDAEMLYQTKLGKIKGLFGATSSQYSSDLAAVSIFYAGQNDRAKAMEYLDQLLALDPRKQELGKTGGGGRKGVLDTTYGLLYKDGHNTLAMDILEKLLLAQRQTYGSDDAHVSAVLTKIGMVETKNGDYGQAEKHLKEAIAVDALYGEGEVFGGSGAKSAMQSLLDKEHKTADMESLIASRKMDHKETEKHWSMAENASEERAQEYYDWWHKKGPYGYRCLSASIKLLEYAVKKQSWDRVRELAPECIKILSHNSLLAVGGCTPSPQPAARKFYCFKSVIEACLESGHADEAHKWLDRAVSEESYEPLTEELIFLSEIENACGNKDAALAYCKRAEGTLPKTSGWNYWRGTIQQLYKKVGSQDDISRLAAEARAQMLIKQEEDLRKFEAARKLKIKLEAQLKQPPQTALAIAPPTARNKKNSSEAEDSIEPKESLMFPPVEEIKNKYLFNYVAYASDDLWLKDGAHVVRYQNRSLFPSYSFAGSYTGMACFQPLHQAGGLLFLYDGPPGSLVPKFELDVEASGRGGQFGGGVPQIHIYRTFTAPPPVMARPFKPAFEAPSTATALPTTDDRVILKAGDYTAVHVTTNSIVLSTPGRVRIFLKDAVLPSPSRYIEKPKSIFELQDADKSIKPVFEATENSCINLAPAYEAFPRSSLELWYNGTGEIWLDDNTHFAGIIYAPNAIIRLGKKVSFWGAMVAKEIIVGEESTLMYQTGLQGWVAEPAGTK